MHVSWAEVEAFLSLPKDLVFQKDRELSTSCEHNEAIFTRLRYGWGRRLDLLINIHFGDTSGTDEKFPMA